MIQYVYDQDTLEVETELLTPPINEMVLIEFII